MSLDKFIESWLSSWIRGGGPESDIVLSSRIRLARNFADIPFPHAASDQQLNEVMARLGKGVSEIRKTDMYSDLELAPLTQMGGIERMMLVEKHLISPHHIDNVDHRAVVLNEKETISIMVNEEDHLRIQCFYPGLQLDKAWEEISRLDDLLDQKLHFSFHEEKGFLTSCPTNVGTGMRASVMVHLPALVMTKQVGRVFNNVSKFGLTVRGLYGEGTEGIGNLFQISNQITLGQKEEEIIDNLYRVTKQVIEQERMMRQAILAQSKVELLNRIGRAYGILKYAHIISSQEAMMLLSDVRLGVDLQLNQDVPPEILNELMILISPAFLQKVMGQQLSSDERDMKRAILIREKMQNTHN